MKENECRCLALVGMLYKMKGWGVVMNERKESPGEEALGGGKLICEFCLSLVQ
jgi:hypothetical protein